MQIRQHNIQPAVTIQIVNGDPGTIGGKLMYRFSGRGRDVIEVVCDEAGTTNGIGGKRGRDQRHRYRFRAI